jgi:hypothetical protein
MSSAALRRSTPFRLLFLLAASFLSWSVILPGSGCARSPQETSKQQGNGEGSAAQPPAPPPAQPEPSSPAALLSVGHTYSGPHPLIPVRDGDFHGAKNTEGKIVVPIEFDEIQRNSLQGAIFARRGQVWRVFHGVTGEQLPPHEFRGFGFEAYNSEIGWFHSGHFYGGMTTFQCGNGKWGVLDEFARELIPCAHDRIIYDGYFSKNAANPIDGMAACRQDAGANGVEILGFVINKVEVATHAYKQRATGYIDTKGRLHKVL